MAGTLSPGAMPFPPPCLKYPPSYHSSPLVPVCDRLENEELAWSQAMAPTPYHRDRVAVKPFQPTIS